MIVGAAFCPVPPVMVPSLGGAASDDLRELRQACLEAIQRVAQAKPETWLILGEAAVSSVYSPVDYADLEVLGRPERIHLGSPACGGESRLTLPLTIGAWVVREALGVRSLARGFGIGDDFETSEAGQELMDVVMSSRTALIVAGDGSARREKTSPGYFDEHAVGFDTEVARALEQGDTHTLALLDPAAGRDLLATGVAPWRIAGGLFDGLAVDAVLHRGEAPFGVGYFVASWLSRDSALVDGAAAVQDGPLQDRYSPHA